ncbi:uncharacterized protein LOC142346091 [Convolutriloba macropyga]|uniref:uncharacterized protein LOC142346091 n=1 Tax=Convolutriloba macropyga TaxID=536237 RepID=UPI003F520493
MKPQRLQKLLVKRCPGQGPRHLSIATTKDKKIGSYPRGLPRVTTDMGLTDLCYADRCFRPNRPKFRYGSYQSDFGHTWQTEQSQGRHWARPNRPLTWARRNRPTAEPGPHRRDPRPTLGQTEQTQSRHWARPYRPKTSA